MCQTTKLALEVSGFVNVTFEMFPWLQFYGCMLVLVLVDLVGFYLVVE